MQTARAQPPEPRAVPVVRHRVAAACALGMLCFAVYLTNLRPMAVQDSIPARLLPFSILREGNLDLSEFHWLFSGPYKPYFLRQVPNGRSFSAYSIGVPVLVTPLYVPVVWALRHYRIDDDDVRFRLVSVVMERISAALIAAASVSLVFLALCRMTSAGIAAGMALAYGLGTSIWSTGSQSLLQHGGAALALAGLSFFLLEPDTRRNAAAAGGCAALAVLARPTMVFFSLLALVFVWWTRRRRLPVFLSLPVAGLAFMLTYRMQLGRLLRGGYHGLHFAVPTLKRFAGLLISPNRGLFMYTPAALLALPIVTKRGAGAPSWVRWLPIGIVTYVVFYSSWRGWWGGDCYGPRFLTDALPAIVLCAAPAVDRLWRARTAGRIVLLALVTWGVVVQGIGTYFDNNSWNQSPIGSWRPRGKRVWDWHDLQILRAAHVGWRGTRLAPLLWQTLTDPRPALLRPIAPEDFVGQLTLEEPVPLRYHPADRPELHVRVTNHGRAGWPAFRDFGPMRCRLVYRWWVNRAKIASGSFSLRRNVYAGGSVQVRKRILMPARRGTYELELAVVQALGWDRPPSRGPSLRVPVHIE